MQSTMMRMPLSLNHVLERAGTLFPESEIVSRLPDKSLRRHRYADFYRRGRALGAALQRLGLRKGERVATLCWNHLATTSSRRSPAPRPASSGRRSCAAATASASERYCRSMMKRRISSSRFLGELTILQPMRVARSPLGCLAWVT